MKNINETNKIISKKDFVDFLLILRDDLKNNSQDWENITLEDFLDGMIAFTQDIDGFYKNVKNRDINHYNVAWEIFSDILLASRIYN
jgi:hypothetical protein